MTTNPPTAALTAAERQRACRQRRREGLRCVTLEIRNSEVDALIRKQLLKPEIRNDLSAIIDALHCFLDQTL
jgi:hypothetical protein